MPAIRHTSTSGKTQYCHTRLIIADNPSVQASVFVIFADVDSDNQTLITSYDIARSIMQAARHHRLGSSHPLAQDELMLIEVFNSRLRTKA